MGRMNRSRKRRDEMNKIKKARYDAKELIRLKKTLGLIDADGNEIMKDVSDVAQVKTAKEIKIEKKTKEEKELEHEMQEQREKGKKIKVVNENTGKEHIYNSKTLRDQFGNYPPWFKRNKTAKRLRKKDHARSRDFKQAWTTINVPL
ncbi:18 kDa learning-associated protein of slug-like [Teleopsis dalmanni]|uniref:18 kDa learning-associated protein of slug-like n=1 Tax=Teleopsis dalmanni TaxID=139649 RepID=UPI0018CF3CE0|nr:18 kDa learning-associated protein of slug-like [Teleopsis dalmanni]XP_037934773.1 18 kDa learning-associated protein of slug-like [Teleopsis dalmanni]